LEQKSVINKGFHKGKRPWSDPRRKSPGKQKKPIRGNGANPKELGLLGELKGKRVGQPERGEGKR